MYTQYGAGYFDWLGLYLLLCIAWSLGIWLVVLFSSCVSVVLFGTPGVFECQDALFLARPRLWFAVGLVRC